MTEERWIRACAIAALLAVGCGTSETNTTPPAIGQGTANPASGVSAENPSLVPMGAAQQGAAAPADAVATAGGAVVGPVAGMTAVDPTGSVPGAVGDPAMAGGDPTMAGVDPAAPAGMDAAAMAEVREDPRGKCGLDSGWAGDEACLLPPDPSEGMQIHIGPKSYDDPAELAPFLMMPGDENSECWTFHTPNTEEVAYQTYELSGRPGTHHIINTMYNTPMTDGGFTVCADPGTGTNPTIIDNLPGASKAYMPRGTVAPEDANIGRIIPPNAASQADMHYFNLTDKPIIREFWMNIYFVDKSKVTERADQIRGMGGLSWSFLAPIAPGTDKVYAYECPVRGNGRILSLLGHYHAHGKHFTASIRRGGTGMVEKVFEMYDYLDPASFEYNSTVKNPAFSDFAAGAVTGTLEVSDGDVIMWDCHIQNDSQVPLTYSNEVETGEMCNLWGSSIGIAPLNCVL